MKKLLLFTAFFLSFQSYSQYLSRDVFATSGSELSSSDILMSFTMGETFTASFDPNTIHNLGFQQGDLSMASVHEFSNDNYALFPNPANEQITFTTSSDSPFTYKVYDVTGRIILSGESAAGVLTLDVHSIVEGKYFLEYIPLTGESHYLPFITIH